MVVITMTDFKLLFILSFIGTAFSDRVVMTNSGPVQGITVSSEPEIEAFLGIPYAEPPIGRMRFMKPVPKRSWLGVYDASKLAPTCIQNASTQYYYMPNIENMTEDCLYLNMWVPYSRNRTNLKPIIFFIHGGAFNLGSSNMRVYDGTRMASRGDVIVVTINYRVGVMGFFSAFTEEVEGNMGAYDQVLALNWVYNNAEAFGGNPNHIVLIGESAGAMSVSGHLAANLTRHLFKRVILQSGAGIQPMSLDEDGRLYKLSQRLATMVGCADKNITLSTDPRLIVSCLRRLPARVLSAAEGILMKIHPITFLPRIGVPDMPKGIVYNLLEGNFKDTEMLIGINKNEGTFFLTAAAPDYFGVYGKDNIKTISRRMAYQITRFIYKNTEQTDEGKIADFYVNSVKNGTSDAYTQAMSDSLGDYLITCGSVFNAEIHSLRNPVYFYVFSHRPSSSPLAEWMGCTHFDEMEYVFGNPLHGNFTPEEEQLSERLMDRWLAFAKTGNPNIPGTLRWPEFAFEQPEYLDIDVEESVRLRPDKYRCEFWRDRFKSVIDANVIQAVRGSRSSSFTSVRNNFLTGLSSAHGKFPSFSCLLISMMWVLVYANYFSTMLGEKRGKLVIYTILRI